MYIDIYYKGYMPPYKDKFEPILQYRFEITNPKAFLPPLRCKSVTLPKINNNEVKFKYGNGYIKAKGITEWEDVEVELYNSTDNVSFSGLRSWLDKHQRGLPQGVNKERFLDDYAPDAVFIEVLNPEGNPVQKYKLYNAYIYNVDFGTMDWESSEPSIIKLTIKYSWAQLELALSD